ncbi:hypothetical protein [Fodinicola feengrottensis]|uniref:hypothetical protein n=1 Tax=Fodinicola feengrottensis TaxID=435914 RepID=UPI0013D0B76F|nr:hypothetical protein [Fodinicola feengrottensis]
MGRDHLVGFAWIDEGEAKCGQVFQHFGAAELFGRRSYGQLPILEKSQVGRCDRGRELGDQVGSPDIVSDHQFS